MAPTARLCPLRVSLTLSLSCVLMQHTAMVVVSFLGAESGSRNSKHILCDCLAALSVGAILESKSRDAVLHLNKGGKIGVTLWFVLTEVERAKIVAMRLESARRRSSSLDPKYLADDAASLQHQGSLEARRYKSKQLASELAAKLSPGTNPVLSISE